MSVHVEQEPTRAVPDPVPALEVRGLVKHYPGVKALDGVDLVVRAAKERLSPILMTSLATGLALVPLAVFGDRPGQEIEHPLAIVILGGLLTSTLLSLFVIPPLYLRFGKSKSELEAAGDDGDGGGTSRPREPVGSPV